MNFINKHFFPLQVVSMQPGNALYSSAISIQFKRSNS